MTKIATIISALAEATQTIATDQWGVDHRVCCGGDTEFDHLSDCLWMQALAAARELRAMKPEGISPINGASLYALDGVKHG